MIEDKVVGMLLAGGQGARLKALTNKVAKPAVPFGGKYRIIDFVLSNAMYSRINDIGVLTQYKPFLLNEHIGIGTAWDYDRINGGLRILAPFMGEDGGRWYIGTANAIYENIDYVDELDPEFVLVLSSDHIYKMDYNELLKAHKANKADVTLAVLEVPWEETSRFGIINIDEDKRVVEFDEKPTNPKNNMASMGIYMFNWAELRKALMEDARDKESHHDFGKNILPVMLEQGKRIFAWKFSGYWKDVGTVRSYWEANMDLLDEKCTLNLYDKNWRVMTRSKQLPPQYIARGAEVNNSLINEGCVIKGEINNSILFSEVKVNKNAKVNDSVILSKCTIEEGAEVYNAVILEEVVIKKGQIIGSKDDENIYMISKDGITIE